jgi:predicted anti-sigma-YlaC factor YlaD
MRIPTCRETSALLSQKQDRARGLGERVGLYLHLAACQACRQFERQLAFMRSALKRYLEGGDRPPR